MKHSDFGLMFWLHVILVLLIFASPFLLDWRIVIVIGCLYQVQLWLLGTCFLTILQFKQKENSFYAYYLTKLGFTVNRKVLRFLLTYVLPLVVLCTAMVWQLVLRNKPLF